MAFRPGIVICSRLDSTRVPNKVLLPLGGQPIIRHLVNQLAPLKIPIVVAVPEKQFDVYEKVLGALAPQVQVYASRYASDPLARMLQVAQGSHDFTHVVRITHDKIFVDTEILKNALTIAQHEDEGIEYIHSSYLTPGTGFEVIKRELLERAAAQFKDVEHITYAVRPLSKLNVDLHVPTAPVNLLIDHIEDVQLMQVLFSQLGNSATLKDVLQYLKKNPDLARINAPPALTVYTCVHNGEKFIERAMNSVARQADFKARFEYLIIDDASTDRTPELVARFAIGRPNVRWIRNDKNLGLSSSSNLALARARGNYILRLDADDHFADEHVLHEMLEAAGEMRAEILYPDNYFGDLTRIQKGNERHHVGGALFDKRALNFLRFKDGLRNHDSLDIFTRARAKLRIKYFEEPTFVYTQRADSMSKTNLDERERTRREIEGGL